MWDKLALKALLVVIDHTIVYIYSGSQLIWPIGNFICVEYLMPYACLDMLSFQERFDHPITRCLNAQWNSILFECCNTYRWIAVVRYADGESVSRDLSRQWPCIVDAIAMKICSLNMILKGHIELNWVTSL